MLQLKWGGLMDTLSEYTPEEKRDITQIISLEEKLHDIENAQISQTKVIELCKKFSIEERNYLNSKLLDQLCESGMNLLTICEKNYELACDFYLEGVRKRYLLQLNKGIMRDLNLAGYLNTAISKKSIDVVKVFIKRGISIGASHVNTSMFTYNFELVKLVIENCKNYDINSCIRFIPNGWTSLDRSKEIMKILIYFSEKKFNLSEEQKYDIVEWAVENGQSEIFSMPFFSEIDINKVLETTAIFAVNYSTVEFIRSLLLYNIDNGNLLTMFLASIKKEKHEIINCIADELKLRNILSRCGKALADAIEIGNFELVKRLVEEGVDFALLSIPYIIKENIRKNIHYDVVKYMINFDRNIDYSSCIYYAAENNNLELLQILFERPHRTIPTKIENINRQNMLITAIKNRNIEVLELLLKNGYNVTGEVLSWAKNTPVYELVSKYKPWYLFFS